MEEQKEKKPVKHKWDVGAHVEESALRVVRRALSRRLKVVRHFLPRAAKRPHKDIEYVHQLRVATRRTLAAMQVFESMLPKRRARKLEKELKRLRRAAGDARDLDVLAERLRKFAQHRPASQWLKGALREVRRWRRQAQEPIVAAHAQWKRKGLTVKTRQLVKRTLWRGDGAQPSFAVVAQVAMRPLVDEFFAAAAGDLTQISTLHEMRIRAKKLRYGMELLGAAFEPRLQEEVYPYFAELQEKLGTINDLAQTGNLIHRWTGQAQASSSLEPFDVFLAEADQQCEKARQEFRQWWTAERCASFRQQFERLLGPLAAPILTPKGDEMPIREAEEPLETHENHTSGRPGAKMTTRRLRPVAVLQGT